MKTLAIRNSTTHDFALLLLRAIAGTVFAYHGAQKLFGLFGGPGLNGFAGYLGTIGIPFPLANAGLAAGAEFFGGLTLLAGVRVGVVSVPLGITMVVACFALRANGFDSQNGGFEFPLTLGILTAAIGLLGAGRFTLGRPWRRVRSSPGRTAIQQPSFS
jgi:putative oxidoreductase